MGFFRSEEQGAVEAVSKLVDCNPFVPERTALERCVLGPAFLDTPSTWHANGEAGIFDPNLPLLRQRVLALTREIEERLRRRPTTLKPQEQGWISGLFLYALWVRYEDDWRGFLGGDLAPAGRSFERFASDAGRPFACLPPPLPDFAHLFAMGFQIRRAFHQILRKIYGASACVAELRAAVWRSVFTHDAALYRVELYRHMAAVPTLIVGESGTGKELVARAIGLAQYVPFDARARHFLAEPARTFTAVNLAAMSPSLIESELFGHQRGSFTGALEDRRGCFEACGDHGALFLDEIGELEPEVQKKLLRVLQSRDFRRIGAECSQIFRGKLLAATNRDLVAEVRARRFREDLYHRICGDVIRTPTLREQLVGRPGDLDPLLALAARRVAAAAAAEQIAHRTGEWIRRHLPDDYPWPGNMRELEQCVRGVLTHGMAHRPPHSDANAAASSDAAEQLAAKIRNVEITADQLLTTYCRIAYQRTASSRVTARRLGLDPRSVRARLRREDGTPAPKKNRPGFEP